MVCETRTHIQNSSSRKLLTIAEQTYWECKSTSRKHDCTATTHLKQKSISSCARLIFSSFLFSVDHLVVFKKILQYLYQLTFLQSREFRTKSIIFSFSLSFSKDLIFFDQNCRNLEPCTCFVLDMKTWKKSKLIYFGSSSSFLLLNRKSLLYLFRLISHPHFTIMIESSS